MGVDFRRVALRSAAFLAGFAILVLMLILAQPAAASCAMAA